MKTEQKLAAKYYSRVGCEGAALSAGTGAYEAAVQSGNLSGNLSGNIVTGTPITVYLHVGSGTNSPISGNWDFNVGSYSTAWTEQFTGDLLNNNWVAVKIPTGTQVDVLNTNGYTYTIPINGGKLSGIGTNVFNSNQGHDVLIAPTVGFAAFVNYSVRVLASTTNQASVSSYSYRL